MLCVSLSTSCSTRLLIDASITSRFLSPLLLSETKFITNGTEKYNYNQKEWSVRINSDLINSAKINFEEMPLKEVAKVVNLTVDNVKTKLFRSRKKLFTLLKKVIEPRTVDLI